jgi:hypothetical protein
LLGSFAVDTLRDDPWTFVAIMVIAPLAVVLDAVANRRAPTRPASMRVTTA